MVRPPQTDSRLRTKGRRLCYVRRLVQSCRAGLRKAVDGARRGLWAHTTSCCVHVHPRQQSLQEDQPKQHRTPNPRDAPQHQDALVASLDEGAVVTSQLPVRHISRLRCCFAASRCTAERTPQLLGPRQDGRFRPAWTDGTYAVARVSRGMAHNG